MSIPIFLVDAFTERPFSGNPAAICILAEDKSDSWLQHVAAEMNQAETAFLWPLTGEGGFRLRWFTPTTEVDLCGHATLGSAHVLWTTGVVPSERACEFHTRSGILRAEASAPWIQLDFPSEPASSAEAPPALLEALGVTPLFVARSRMDYLVELESEDQVRNLKPNLPLLAQVGGRGVIVTSRSSSPEFDFISRFFGPNAGIDEDPVTGSAHCTLAPFWQERFGRAEMTGYQASARGGVVRVVANGSRVRLSGQAVLVLRGELTA